MKLLNEENLIELTDENILIQHVIANRNITK